MEYKGYKISPIANLIGYQLQYIGKGSLHKSLKGFFTSIGIAQEAIDSYLKKNGKEDSDGKTSSSGRNKPIHAGPSNRRESINDS